MTLDRRRRKSSHDIAFTRYLLDINSKRSRRTPTRTHVEKITSPLFGFPHFHMWSAGESEVSTSRSRALLTKLSTHSFSIVTVKSSNSWYLYFCRGATCKSIVNGASIERHFDHIFSRLVDQFSLLDFFHLDCCSSCCSVCIIQTIDLIPNCDRN